MNQQNNSFDNLESSQDDVQIETEGSICSRKISSTSSPSNLMVPKNCS